MSTAQTQGTGTPPQRGSRTPDDRLATALRWLRWPVVVAWLIAIVALIPLARTLSHATSDTASAYLPASAASARVARLQAPPHAGGHLETSQATVIFTRSSGLTAPDAVAISSARTAVAGLVGRVPGLSEPAAVLRSADGQAAVFTVAITGPARSASTDRDAVTAIRAAIADSAGSAESADAGLTATVTGPAALSADLSAGGQQAILLLTALVVLAVIMLLVYGSPLLWVLPLLGTLAAIVVALAAAHGLASAGLTLSTLSAGLLIAGVFGAASNYGLLLVNRYRSELRRQAMPEAAMATALRRTLPAVAASAATVACALLCLLTAHSASLRGLGPAGAAGMVAALAAQVTFLPALLLTARRAAFWPRIPRAGTAGQEESRLWARIAGRVARRPVTTLVVTVALLGGACAGLLSLRISDSPLDEVKGSPASVSGARLLASHYPAGELAPLVLLVPRAEASAAASAAGRTPGVVAVTSDGHIRGYTSYSVILSAPFGPTGKDAIAGLRQRLAARAPGSLVGGTPAIQYDIARAADRDEKVIIPLVLIVILLFISVALRAIIAPIVLVVTTALTFEAAFGLSSLLWRYGFGYPGIQSTLPAYVFVFVVAFGVDYSIFLYTRVRAQSRALGVVAGTRRGVGLTGGVVAAAGLIVAAAFAALTQVPPMASTEVGTAVALGALLDALLVRTILVPATLIAIGDRAWWPSRPRGRHRGESRVKSRLAGHRPSFPSLSR